MGAQVLVGRGLFGKGEPAIRREVLLSLFRSRRAAASEGLLISVCTSSIALKASDVVHSVAVETSWPSCLPAAVPGTWMLDRSKIPLLVKEQAV